MTCGRRIDAVEESAGTELTVLDELNGEVVRRADVHACLMTKRGPGRCFGGRVTQSLRLKRFATMAICSGCRDGAV